MKTGRVAAFSIHYVHSIPLSFSCSVPTVNRLLSPPVQRPFVLCLPENRPPEFCQGWYGTDIQGHGVGKVVKESNSFYPDSPYFIPFPFKGTWQNTVKVFIVNLYWYKLLVFFFKVRATLYISAGGRQGPEKIRIHFKLL